jgi:hypothetical protein
MAMPYSKIPHHLRVLPWAACMGLSALGRVCAQDATAEPPAQAPMQLAQAHIERQIFINDGAETFQFALGEADRERVVKGAPYCADAVHETVQWLADASGGTGNRIVRQQSTRLCRDGEGRTRQDVERGGRKLVYLRDPVAGENWVLDTERKTARRLSEAHLPGDGMDSPAWRDYAERMKEWARSMADRARSGNPTATPATPPTPPSPPTPPTPPTPALAPTAPTPVVITRHDGGAREVEVNVVRMRAGSDMQLPAEWAVPPPAVQWRAQTLAPRGAGTVSPLGGKDIEGVRANGERTAWVIEAGKIGNEKPIQITREVWTAPDLMVTLLSRDFDPRTGEVSYRLKNLKRGEPDAALMRVPAEFNRPARPAQPPKAPAPAR